MDPAQSGKAGGRMMMRVIAVVNHTLIDVRGERGAGSGGLCGKHCMHDGDGGVIGETGEEVGPGRGGEAD